MDLAKIQQELRNQKLDGWLFFDHHMRDPLAYRVLGFAPPRTPTRRWYYLIPAEGEPRGLEHRIERNMTGPLPGEKIPYSSWTEQVEGLRRITAGLRRVAMQYSPMCAIPYVSMVDGGTVELVRSVGVDVVSSAELIQYFEARWSPEALESHLEAGRRVDRVRAEGFDLIRERTRNGAAGDGTGSEAADPRRFFQGRTDHRSRPHCGSECQRLEPALRAERGDELAHTARRLGADRYVGQAGPAGRRVLRHHLDRFLRRARRAPAQRRDAQGLRGGQERARCRHPAGQGCRGGRPAAAAASKWMTPAAA